MAYNDNKDILSWKRVLENLQKKTDEGVEQYNKVHLKKTSLKEGGVHKLRVDQQTHVTAEHHDVVVSSNDMGIIVDIYDKKSDNIDTNTYWNDDVMEGKERVTEESKDEELINKVAEWIYHESSEPISEIEYLLKKSGAVGEYMDAVSENKEKVTEGTWSIPDTPEKVKELKDLMKQELPAAGAHDKIYHLLGDDELFDELDAMEEKDPKADVRGMIVRRLDDLGLLKKKEVTEDKVFKVKDIEWDTEDSTGEGPEGLDLPTSLTVSVPKEHLGSYEDTEEFISDFISNVTGFTHKGYRTNPDI